MKRIIILLTALLIAVTAVAQVGRYQNIRVLYPGYSLRFDTSTGKYTTVKWTPVDKDGKEIEASIDTALANAKDKLRKALKSLEESLESL